MKTLSVIQTIAKIGKIICKVVRICCIVGFFLCAAGVVGLALGNEALKLGGVTIQSMIENSAEMTLPATYTYLAVAMAFCAAEVFLCRKAEVYCENELADGTPFTLRGAGELMRLGILAFAVSTAVVIACSIGVAVVGHFDPSVSKEPLDSFSSAGVGVALIALSLVFRCGAEQIEEAKEKTPSDGEPEEDREES